MIDNLFSMHGYGMYVWSSFAATFFIFMLNITSVFFEKKLIKKKKALLNTQLNSSHEC